MILIYNERHSQRHKLSVNYGCFLFLLQKNLEIVQISTHIDDEENDFNDYMNDCHL